MADIHFFISFRDLRAFFNNAPSFPEREFVSYGIAASQYETGRQPMLMQVP